MAREVWGHQEQTEVLTNRRPLESPCRDFLVPPLVAGPTAPRRKWWPRAEASRRGFGRGPNAPRRRWWSGAEVEDAGLRRRGGCVPVSRWRMLPGGRAGAVARRGGRRGSRRLVAARGQEARPRDAEASVAAWRRGGGGVPAARTRRRAFPLSPVERVPLAEMEACVECRIWRRCGSMAAPDDPTGAGSVRS
jgi:hypothetical protein